jgi:hypothetical protein
MAIDTGRKPITVDLGDGVERTLRFTLRVANRIKQQFGGFEAMNQALKSDPLEILPDLLHAGMKPNDDVTPDDIQDIIDMARIAEITDAFSEAFNGKKPEKNGLTLVPPVENHGT